MKRISVFFSLLFLVCFFSGEAQVITGSSGDTIKVIQSNGNVEDYYGEKLGYFDSEGKLYNRLNELLGKVSGGKIYDLQLNEIASIDANGYVKDYNGDTIGRVHNGQITDAQNNVLGGYSGIDPEKATVLLLIMLL